VNNVIIVNNRITY